MFSPVMHAARIRTHMTSWLAGMAIAMVMVQHSATRIEDHPEMFR